MVLWHVVGESTTDKLCFFLKKSDTFCKSNIALYSNMPRYFCSSCLVMCLQVTFLPFLHIYGCILVCVFVHWALCYWKNMRKFYHVKVFQHDHGGWTLGVCLELGLGGLEHCIRICQVFHAIVVWRQGEQLQQTSPAPAQLWLLSQIELQLQQLLWLCIIKEQKLGRSSLIPSYIK